MSATFLRWLSGMLATSGVELAIITSLLGPGGTVEDHHLAIAGILALAAITAAVLSLRAKP